MIQRQSLYLAHLGIPYKQKLYAISVVVIMIVGIISVKGFRYFDRIYAELQAFHELDRYDNLFQTFLGNIMNIHTNEIFNKILGLFAFKRIDLIPDLVKVHKLKTIHYANHKQYQMIAQNHNRA